MSANDVPCCKPMFWAYLVICVALVAFAGLMSGLTLGLMSLSQVDLEVLIKAGQPRDRRNAEKILPLVENKHLLLCTLLIGNALAMEALPIFIDSIMPAWSAILISVTLILVFGEIIPQAVCSRYGLSVGAKLSFIVWLILIVFFPLSYPISKLLDSVLGKNHSALFKRAELKTLVDMHANEAGKGGELSHEETSIITGALDMTQKTAKDAMTPISKIFSLDINSKLDVKTMELILRKGRSRIPICSGSPKNIIGLILVKNLIRCRPEDETPIKDLTIRRIQRVHDGLPLYEILNQFLKGHSHMAVVFKCRNDAKSEMGTHCYLGVNDELVRRSPSVVSINSETRSPSSINKDLDANSESLPKLQDHDEEVVGIITLEDVMEELLQEEILDETDDVHNRSQISLPPLPSTVSLGAASASNIEYPTLMGAASASNIEYPTLMGAAVYSYRHNNVSSPRSSYSDRSAVLSPVSPYTQSPIAQPSLGTSPAPLFSPSRFKGSACYSPSSYQVLRK